jgi:DNA-binding YbaB/EbfC family protein
MNINLGDILKNAQNLQQQMGVLQEKLALIRVTGSAGGGMVTVDLNGRMEVLAVRIEEELFAGGDRELIQDLTAAAFTSAVEKVKETMSRELGALAGMAGFPGFPGIPGFPVPGR